MQTNKIVLTIALITLTTACEQKKPVPNEAPVKVIQTQAPKIEQAPAKIIEVQKGKKLAPPKTESSEKNTPVVYETSEQALAEVAKHAREITNSQESKTRTRAQIAEDEMTKDLEKFK